GRGRRARRSPPATARRGSAGSRRRGCRDSCAGRCRVAWGSPRSGRRGGSADRCRGGLGGGVLPVGGRRGLVLPGQGEEDVLEAAAGGGAEGGEHQLLAQGEAPHVLGGEAHLELPIAAVLEGDAVTVQRGAQCLRIEGGDPGARARGELLEGPFADQAPLG